VSEQRNKGSVKKIEVVVNKIWLRTEQRRNVVQLRAKLISSFLTALVLEPVEKWVKVIENSTQQNSNMHSLIRAGGHHRWVRISLFDVLHNQIEIGKPDVVVNKSWRLDGVEHVSVERRARCGIDSNISEFLALLVQHETDHFGTCAVRFGKEIQSEHPELPCCDFISRKQ
jgi:hypothetical protein